jgi:opacity protein-like surface antigen
MKKGLLSFAAFVALSSFGMAGGDIAPVEPVVAPVVHDDGEDYWYVGAGLIYNRVYSTDSGWFDDGVATQDETEGLVGIIGYEYNRYIAIEGRLTSSFWERDYADITTWSIFLKPQYQFRDDDEIGKSDDGFFTVYGLIGFGNSYVEGSSGDNDLSAHPDVIGKEIMDETGFQWGIGVSYTFEKEPDEKHTGYRDSWSVFIDYTVTAKDASINSTLYDYDPNIYHELSSDGVTIGVIYKF